MFVTVPANGCCPPIAYLIILCSSHGDTHRFFRLRCCMRKLNVGGRNEGRLLLRYSKMCVLRGYTRLSGNSLTYCTAVVWSDVRVLDWRSK